MTDTEKILEFDRIKEKLAELEWITERQAKTAQCTPL